MAWYVAFEDFYVEIPILNLKISWVDGLGMEALWDFGLRQYMLLCEPSRSK